MTDPSFTVAFVCFVPDQETRHLEVAAELESLYEAKIAKLTEFSKDLQVRLDDTKALAAAREAELLAVNEATKRKIVEHCKDMLSKSTMRQTDLQVYVEYVKKEYEEMLNVQDSYHDGEVAELKARVTKAGYDIAETHEQMKSMRAQMARSIAGLKESLEKVRRTACWSR